ncbi:MAG: translation initiation factor IF-2 [Patescibacteria group bacterium]|nr:translation initiation factor IF-2 [Patescibacteria group bacterium]
MPQKLSAQRTGKRQKKREDRKTAHSGMAQKKENSQERRRQKEQKTIVANGAIEISLPPVSSVGEFARKLSLPVTAIISELLKNGVVAAINESIDFDTMAIIAGDLGFIVKLDESEESLLIAAEKDERSMLEKLLSEDKKSDSQPRPPIISVMGHVDHGKTSLLDALRETNVAAGEAGGITQHIGAYQVDWKGRKITFLDTPGHAAFTVMRARGAKATDIAILVVAANDGVKPQTIEAIHHARDAKIPIVVAINKVDLPEADINKVKSELSEHDLIPEEWGGKTVMAEVSAKQKKGVENLLDLVLLTSDMEDLRANPDRLAVGTVIEADLDSKLGPVATVLINTGTLRRGDPVVVGAACGRVRLMIAPNGKQIKEASPSTPVRISGLDLVPAAGEILTVKTSEKEAKFLATKVRQHREARSMEQKKIGLAKLSAKIAKGDVAVLKIIVKADVDGSLQAIKQCLSDIKSEKAAVQIIHSGIGQVNESDVMMAAAAEAVVITFHLGVNNDVKKLALREGVEIKQYDVIYHLTEDIEKTLSGMLQNEVIEEILGELKVKAIFMTSAKAMIVGGDVKSGKFTKDTVVRVYRDGEIIGEGKTDSVQEGKVPCDSVEEGHECGLHFIGKVRIQEKDRLLSIRVTVRKQEL